MEALQQRGKGPSPRLQDGIRCRARLEAKCSGFWSPSTTGSLILGRCLSHWEATRLEGAHVRLFSSQSTTAVVLGADMWCHPKGQAKRARSIKSKRSFVTLKSHAEVC